MSISVCVCVHLWVYVREKERGVKLQQYFFNMQNKHLCLNHPTFSGLINYLSQCVFGDQYQIRDHGGESVPGRMKNTWHVHQEHIFPARGSSQLFS